MSAGTAAAAATAAVAAAPIDAAAAPHVAMSLPCRKLKAAAEEVLSEPWEYLYSCQVVRTSRGKGFGLLVCSYGLGWHLWPADEGASFLVSRKRCALLDVVCGVL